VQGKGHIFESQGNTLILPFSCSAIQSLVYKDVRAGPCISKWKEGGSSSHTLWIVTTHMERRS